MSKSPAADALNELATRGTVMAVWAHPDDESFCGAGLMMAAAAAGRRVVNVSATLGELGTDDPTRWPPERLGRRRNEELATALDHLGGAEIELLGIRDGSCEVLDPRMGARRVATAINRHEPDVILTFGRDGVTGHPDHQAINRWTTLAAEACDPSVPVVEAVTASAWPTDLIDPMNDVGAFFPGYPAHAAHDDDVSIVLHGERLDAKLAALGSHESQIGPLRDRLGEADFRRLFANEAYRPANAAARRELSISAGAGTGRLMPVA